MVALDAGEADVQLRVGHLNVGQVADVGAGQPSSPSVEFETLEIGDLELAVVEVDPSVAFDVIRSSHRSVVQGDGQVTREVSEIGFGALIEFEIDSTADGVGLNSTADELRPDRSPHVIEHDVQICPFQLDRKIPSIGDPD